jgi:2'-5' RNA ligase
MDMRLFVALDIDDAIRERISRFAEQMRPLAQNARWVKDESLHVTLKFIGERPDSTVNEIEAVLKSIQVPEFRISYRGAGFFPTSKAARIFWIGIEADDELKQLAAATEATLAEIGIPREDRAFSPHLTLARVSGRSGDSGWHKGDKSNRQFLKLQEFLQKNSAPDFGSMTSHEFFLYRSELSSKGSQYTKISRFALHEAGN